MPDVIRTLSAREVTERIRAALISSPLGRRPDAVSAIAEAANSNRRSVKNWLQGLNAPNSASLINMARRIPEIRQVALQLIEGIPEPTAEDMTAAAEKWLAWHAKRVGADE